MHNAEQIKFLVKLFITAETRLKAESQLELVLKQIPNEYAYYVYDVDVGPNDKVAALDDVTITPCIILTQLQDLSCKRSLMGTFENDVVKRFLLSAYQSERPDSSASDLE